MPYYFLVFIPFIVIVAAQLVKIIIDLSKNSFSWQMLMSYGGMPSAHSAFVSSLVLVIFIVEGFESMIFLFSLVFASIVIRDALGLRQYISQQSKVINALISQLPDKKQSDIEILPERVGHTPAQVIAGIAFGFILTYILLMIFFSSQPLELLPITL